MFVCVPFEKKDERNGKEKKANPVLKVALLGLVGVRSKISNKESNLSSLAICVILIVTL